MAEAMRGTYTSRGLSLSYLEWGAHDAPVLVLLHGGLEHAQAWDHIAPVLAQEWRVIAPDMRGHGESDWAPGSDYSAFDFASDLAVLFDHAGIETAALVGHSLGGSVACTFTALYPDKIDRLCVIEGLRPAGKTSPATAEDRIAAIRAWSDKGLAAPRRKRIYPDVAAVAARLADHDPLLLPELARDLAIKGTRAVEGGVVWKYDERVRAGSLATDLAPEPSAFWEQISCPVLLVYGAESWATNPADDGRIVHFQTARVASVAGAGHNVHHNQPDAFLTLVQDFLGENLAS